MSENLTDDSAVERALRVGLEEFDLSEEDRSLVDGEYDEDGYAIVDGPLPVVAVVGRPNVGKSTLVNRILGRREAVVEDVPGVTRDRVAYDGEWTGRRFTLVDTGGWEIDATGIHLRVAEQAEVAVDLADVVMFVVDATVGATDDDEAVVKLLRRSGKPVILVANKVDDQRTEADAAALWNLGLGQPWPVSALHGRGSGDVLDAVLDVLPDDLRATPTPTSVAARVGSPWSAAPTSASPRCSTSWPARTASSSTTSPAPRATRSTSSSSSAARPGASSTRPASAAACTRRAAPTSTPRCAPRPRSRRPRSPSSSSTPSSPSPSRTSASCSTVIDAGRALVIAYNKWDLLDEERRHYLEREIERELVQVPWAPRVNISAKTGRHVEKLVPALERALESWDYPRLDRSAQRVPRRDRRRPPAPRARWQAAPHPVRDPGLDPSAAVRDLRLRLHRGRLPPLPRASPARGVRLRGHAHRGVRPGAREAQAQIAGGTAYRFQAEVCRALRFRSLPRSCSGWILRGQATGCGAAW